MVMLCMYRITFGEDVQLWSTGVTASVSAGLLLSLLPSLVSVSAVVGFPNLYSYPLFTSVVMVLI